jgi:hypothetical protein
MPATRLAAIAALQQIMLRENVKTVLNVIVRTFL